MSGDALSADADPTDPRRLELLELSRARLENLLALSADWIWEQDAEGRMTFVSNSVTAATGLHVNDLLGRRRETFDDFDADAAALGDYRARVQARQPFRNFVYGTRRVDGARCYIRISGEPLFDPDGRFAGYRGVGSDVTATTLAQREVQRLAHCDSLTGLANRARFMEELARTIGRASRHDGRFALCFIDLDHFKSVNDRLGHAAGDELLLQMARRLQAVVRAGDFVARLGGDEFVVLLDGPASDEALKGVGRKLLAAVAEPLVLQGCAIRVSASVGVARYPDDGREAAVLLQHADNAMYEAKGEGRNGFRLFALPRREQVERELALETDLRDALVTGQLSLHYQPRFRLGADGEDRLAAVEALLRWHHPTQGLLLPGHFIPLAEERGLILDVGRYVLRRACAQLREWHDAGYQVPLCAVNVSARHFEAPSLVADIADSTAEHGFPPEALEIEITESALMHNPAQAGRVLQALTGMGVGVALDDFGTGYSSLAYLKRFAAGTVKVDRSFVQGLPDDRDDAAITRTVIAMAHGLGRRVVAEGVETKAQLEWLRGLGCDEAQGFLLGVPMPPDRLAQHLARR